MMFSFIQPLSKKSKQAKIPDVERLRALAEHRITGRDLAEITRELYERHDLKPPVHAAQAFSAFAARLRKLVEEGDAATIELCERVEADFQDRAPAAAAHQVDEGEVESQGAAEEE